MKQMQSFLFPRTLLYFFIELSWDILNLNLGSALLIKTKTKAKETMDVLFLLPAFWYCFYSFIVGLSHIFMCLTFIANIERSFYTRRHEVMHFLIFIIFIMAQPGSIAAFADNSKLIFLVDDRDLHPDI